MRKWILSLVLPSVMLLVLLGSLGFLPAAAHNVKASSQRSKPNAESYAANPIADVKAQSLYGSMSALTVSQELTAATGSLVVTTPQTGDGSAVQVAVLTVSDTVTLSLHTDEAGAPSPQSVFSTASS